MSNRRAFWAVLAGGLVLALFTVSRAQVDARRLEEILKKEVLAPDDLAVIDAFLSDAVGRLVRTIDFTEVAKYRAVIVSHQGVQAQYAQRFSEAAYREIAGGFEYAASGISSPERRFKVFTNLLILVSELNDPRLVDLALRRVPQENSTVRYWAIRAATSPPLWDKLSQDRSAASQLAGKVIAACGQVVETSSPEVLHLMAQFAGRNATPAADELLVRIADARMRSYADWTVRNELMDTTILKLLSGRITAGGTANPQLARAFAQLYSFAIQRYLRGVQGNALSETSRSYLGAVLVETEEQCLSKLLGAPQAGVRRAVESGDLNALQAEHDRLLGGPNQAGALLSRLNFGGYGTTGNSRTPLVLPEPPQGKPAPETQPGTRP
jgi:hypothetical protein